jgi:hypothetical protein
VRKLGSKNKLPRIFKKTNCTRCGIDMEVVNLTKRVKCDDCFMAVECARRKGEDFIKNV